ncbi:MAG: hypothetical protein LBU37_09580 [Tannerellaceae bacterium]|jgi:hypothetical protein|nr:hypothetical protein [Tannerellaceae bacterium]
MEDIKESDMTKVTTLVDNDYFRTITANGNSGILPFASFRELMNCTPMGIYAPNSGRTSILIKTNISKLENKMFVLEIKGNSYDVTRDPFNILLQGYNYSIGNEILASSAHSIGWDLVISAFIFEGYLCFWIPNQRLFNSFLAYVYVLDGEVGKPIFNAITGMSALEEMPSSVERLIVISPRVL